MPDLDLITAAVFNNAVWCDAVCQALGCDTDFVDDLWINSGTSPPFYPNAISLTRDGSEAQSRRIREMVQAGLPDGWTEKDAFETPQPGRARLPRPVRGGVDRPAARAGRSRWPRPPMSRGCR